jgi:hypothetical protein
MQDEIPTKAKKREIKKRPRMAIHGRSLKLPAKYGGHKLAKSKR